jgi:hypothetical protein
MTARDAQAQLIGELEAHLRLNACYVDDPTLAKEASDMLARLTNNKPLATEVPAAPAAQD